VNNQFIPEALRQWAASDADCDTKLNQLMKLFAEAVDCPRCFLYLRNPDLKRANTTHAWWSEAQYAIGWESWFSSVWAEEGDNAEEDPMYGEAMVNSEALYIQDVDNDPSGLVNAAFEHEIFKHSALIHAPIYHQGKLYGILEPSYFHQPRDWSQADKAVTVWAQAQLGPIVADYVTTYGPSPSGALSAGDTQD
jgi:GAF domain-containing protein